MRGEICPSVGQWHVEMPAGSRRACKCAQNARSAWQVACSARQQMRRENARTIGDDIATMSSVDDDRCHPFDAMPFIKKKKKKKKKKVWWRSAAAQNGVHAKQCQARRQRV